ncbi:MAG: TonB family protein [Spirochaetota bacterium]
MNVSDRDRLIASIIISVVLYSALFFFMSFIHWESSFYPRYSGPMYVELPPEPDLSQAETETIKAEIIKTEKKSETVKVETETTQKEVTTVETKTAEKAGQQQPPPVPLKSPVPEKTVPEVASGTTGLPPSFPYTGYIYKPPIARESTTPPVTSGKAIPERITTPKTPVEPTPTNREIERVPTENAALQRPPEQQTPAQPQPKVSVQEAVQETRPGRLPEAPQSGSETGGMFQDRLSELDRAFPPGSEIARLESAPVAESVAAPESVTKVLGSSDSPLDLKQLQAMRKLLPPVVNPQEYFSRELKEKLSANPVPNVIVMFDLLPSGIITGLKMSPPSAYPELDSAVLKAIRQWRFQAVDSAFGNVRVTLSFPIVIAR